MGPNKRAVINMSLGYTGFACDGNSPMDRLMNNLAIKHPHIVLVASAGNSGSDGCHFEGDVPASGHIDVKLAVKGTNRCTVHIWQAKTEISTFTVIPPPDAKRPPSAPFTSGQNRTTHQFPYGNVCRIASSIHDYNQKRRTTFVLEKADWFELYEGEWTIRVQGPAPFPGSNRRFHAWVDVNDWSGRSGHSPKLVGATPATTLESPATADLVIAVGAYTVRATQLATEDQPLEGLAFFSSQGPLLNDALQPSNRLKPDISAPGLIIHSADNRLSKDPTFEFVARYYGQGGTSQASPHVAGVIALLLQKEPNLTRQEVYDRITQNARRDDKTGVSANPQWGYGKIDAWKVLYPGVPLPP
jgi:subtilisin family serine protease